MYIASLSIRALFTFLSWNITRLVSSAYNFCILPLEGSTFLVISEPEAKTLDWFIPVLELNIPEYIIVLGRYSLLLSSEYIKALGAKPVWTLLYPPLILDSSTYQSLSGAAFFNDVFLSI